MFNDRLNATEESTMNHIIVITIGDYALEGHEKIDDYHVCTNKPRDDVRDAWFVAKERLPECCPANYCSEEERSIGEKHLAALRSNGAPIPTDPSWVSPDDMLALTLWFLSVGDPDLRFEILNAQPLMFGGTDKEGRHSETIGYACVD
jgi:hypothetical protein